jgi:hypothetical protein
MLPKIKEATEHLDFFPRLRFVQVEGMLVVETFARIRREHFVKGKAIKEPDLLCHDPHDSTLTLRHAVADCARYENLRRMI